MVSLSIPGEAARAPAPLRRLFIFAPRNARRKTRGGRRRDTVSWTRVSEQWPVRCAPRAARGLGPAGRFSVFVTVVRYVWCAALGHGENASVSAPRYVMPMRGFVRCLWAASRVSLQNQTPISPRDRGPIPQTPPSLKDKVGNVRSFLKRLRDRACVSSIDRERTVTGDGRWTTSECVS